MNDSQKGMLYMVFSALFFSLMQIGVKLCGDGIPAMEKVLFRCLISAVIAYPISRSRTEHVLGLPSQQGHLLARSICGISSDYLFFLAAAAGVQADITILVKLSPFYITVLAVIFLRERLLRSQVLSLFIALCGAWIVTNPSFGEPISKPLLCAFCAGILTAVGYLFLRMMRENVDPFVILFYLSTFGTLVGLPLCFRNFVIPNGRECLFLLMIGICSFLGQLCVTNSYRYAEASRVSVYNFSGIVFSSVLGVVFFGDVLSRRTLIGGALVIAAALIAYRGTAHVSGREKQ